LDKYEQTIKRPRKNFDAIIRSLTTTAGKKDANQTSQALRSTESQEASEGEESDPETEEEPDGVSLTSEQSIECDYVTSDDDDFERPARPRPNVILDSDDDDSDVTPNLC
jgi:hypothetical protein